MADSTGLERNSPQFSYLEYFLQLSLHASSATIVGADALSNPHNTTAFEKRCNGILTLDVWLDPSVFSAPNSEEEVLRRGFTFNSSFQGLTVGVGTLATAAAAAVKEQAAANSGSTTIVRKALLCKVGIGRSFPLEAEKLGTSKCEPLPENYDSYYILEREDADSTLIPNTDMARLNDINCKAHPHNYYIQNSAQILPMYLVHYEYDPIKEMKLREKPSCDNCEKAAADFYCAADMANLCKSCDKQLHSANKLVSRHVRTPIGKGADVLGKCREHPDKFVEFFCSQCNMPVCVHCKMVGHHSSGEAARHKLIGVAEAHTAVLSDSQKPDTRIAARRDAIVSQLSAIQARARALEKHSMQVQNQLEQMLRRAMEELQGITRRKMFTLAGDMWELRRQMDEINSLESFLGYQLSGDPTTFLFSWARHQQMRADLHLFKHFRSNIDVQLDIKCAGNVSILVDPSYIVAANGVAGGRASTIGISGITGGSSSGNVSYHMHKRYNDETQPIRTSLVHGYSGGTSGAAAGLAISSPSSVCTVNVRNGGGSKTRQIASSKIANEQFASRLDDECSSLANSLILSSENQTMSNHNDFNAAKEGYISD